jgi:integrase
MERVMPRENQRERVLTAEEESRYLAAAAHSEGLLLAYNRALQGIRATLREEQPIKPVEPFLLRDVATVLQDCGLRPEECCRLKWENVRDGGIEVFKGKREGIATARPGVSAGIGDPRNAKDEHRE